MWEGLLQKRIKCGAVGGIDSWRACAVGVGPRALERHCNLCGVYSCSGHALESAIQQIAVDKDD